MSNTPGATATRNGTRRVATETKSSFKTTEFIAYVAAVVAVLIASLLVDQNDDAQAFGARHAWLYVTLLTIGYMVSRGLAKAGSYERERQSND